MVEFTLEVPGNYILVDHALARLQRGLAGFLIAEVRRIPTSSTALSHPAAATNLSNQKEPRKNAGLFLLRNHQPIVQTLHKLQQHLLCRRVGQLLSPGACQL